MDLALNNLQRLICPKTQQTKPNLQWAENPHPPNELLGYDIKPSDGEASTLEILGMWITPH